MHLQLNNFTQKLDFHVLWFRRRRAYKIRKKKRKKKRKKIRKKKEKKGKKKKEKKGKKGKKRKKKEKKEKKGKKKEIYLIAAKSGLVGMKGYLETYNHTKYFLPYLSRFWLRRPYYAKLAGRFSGPKTKVTWLIASKFGTNIQLINLKLLSKFHVARPNRSGVISKSLKFCTR